MERLVSVACAGIANEDFAKWEFWWSRSRIKDVGTVGGLGVILLICGAHFEK